MITLQKKTWKEHNPNWQEIPHHPYRILMISCGSGKTNALLNLINHEPDIDVIYFYAKDPYEVKYQLLINKRESTSLKCFSDSKAFIEHSNDMDDIYKRFGKNTIQIKNQKYWLYVMMWLLVCLVIKSLIK